MLDQLTITLTSAINAEGRIKYYSILRGCSYFLPLPISLFLFHLGFSPYWFYIIWIFTWNGIGSLIILYYAHKNCGMQYADFFQNYNISYTTNNNLYIINQWDNYSIYG